MSDIPQALRSALAERYDLQRVIGRGGMATVYLANDVRHRRTVAVKVLKPELAASLGTNRFLKEIEIAAGLTHPHIVPLYDSGEADTFLYYVMPFIEGGSLRTRLGQDHPVDIGDALSVSRRVADALTYAHRRGIVHRDIKPENILFAEGHPIVADFGIAKAVSTAGGALLTRTGFALGTPGYMSPEQAAGVRDLDARTDVFSLACVVYEMLIGETPGMWLTDEAVTLGRFIDASPDHRDRLDRISGSVEHVLVKALALRPDQRHATPSEFADALNEATGRTQQYGESEMRRIIGRAAEMQAERPTEEGALSVGAMEQVAAEVGISPARVREAALEIRQPTPLPTTGEPSTGWSWFLGRPHKLVIERVAEGEVPEEEFPFLVDEIRRAIGTVGIASTFVRSVAWSTAPPGQGTGRNVQITIAPRSGQTRIHIEEHFANLLGGLYGGVFGGGGGAVAAVTTAIAMESLGMPLLAAAGAIVGLGGGYGLARWIFTQAFGKRKRELHTLADRLADHITLGTRGRLNRGDPSRRLPP
jgi:tRNA A-37 threonylcarbamoyl transferase component Bud32